VLLIQWVFDKLGYMPKVSIDTNWPFPATAKEYVAPDFEKPVKKATKKATVPKATTRKKKA
jgi:hypothetical protein